MFRFPEGNGEVVNSMVANHAIPGYSTDCGYKVSIQPWNKDWTEPIGEPVEEFLKAGPIQSKSGDPAFHPGNATSSEDSNPALEIGGAADCGDEDGAEGTCLLSYSGKGPDKKGKLSIFTNSAIKAGVAARLFNGYAPNLIGLKAHFTQFMMEKLPGSTAKNDPTCLIIGARGSDAEQQVVQLPLAQTAGQAKPTGPTKAKAAAPAAKAKSAPAPAAVPTPAATATPAGGGDVDDVIESEAVTLLSQVGELRKGQTVTRQKIGSQLVTLLAKNRIPIPHHKPIQALISANDEWFAEKVEEFGWTFDAAAGTVEIPSE